MKTKALSLATMLVLAFSTTAFADGETGTGGKAFDLLGQAATFVLSLFP